MTDTLPGHADVAGTATAAPTPAPVALTVKSHLARIARKLGTGDRAEMVALAMRAGVIR